MNSVYDVFGALGQVFVAWETLIFGVFTCGAMYSNTAVHFVHTLMLYRRHSIVCVCVCAYVCVCVRNLSHSSLRMWMFVMLIFFICGGGTFYLVHCKTKIMGQWVGSRYILSLTVHAHSPINGTSICLMHTRTGLYSKIIDRKP